MPKPGDRIKSKKFVRTVGGVKVRYIREKASKKKDALSGKVLAGVPHGTKKGNIGKLAKTHRRPSAPFGGILNGESRRVIFEDSAKIASGHKKLEDASLKEKPFITQALKIINPEALQKLPEAEGKELLETGTVCIKLTGRNAGAIVAVMEEEKNGRILIEGIGVKKKPCNPTHVYPTGRKIKISGKASHQEIIKALKGEN